MLSLRKNDLKKKVAWISVGGLDRYQTLWMYIKDMQIKLRIPTTYNITSDEEWHIVNEIISEYKNVLAIRFLGNKLKVIPREYKMTNEQYFAWTLYGFLSEHLCDYEFLGHKMHKQLISETVYNDHCRDVTYQLTSFAMAFYKLLYITALMCKEIKILGEYFDNEKNIEEVLKTKQQTISWTN